MSDLIDRISERLRQNRTAVQDYGQPSRASAPPLTTESVGTFVAGDRVFDAITGREGVVTSATGFGAAPFGTVELRLDTGERVTRKPGDLVSRPTPPAPRS